MIWTPHVPDPDLQRDEWLEWKGLWDAAHEERRNGGAAALYHYLMGLDLEGFSESTWPPMTQAKSDLIDLNLDSRERFWSAWIAEDVPLPCVPVTSELLHDAYAVWANKTKIGRTAPLHSFMAFVGKQKDVKRSRNTSALASSTRKKTVVYPPYNLQPPAHQTISAWLGTASRSFPPPWRPTVADAHLADRVWIPLGYPWIGWGIHRKARAVTGLEAVWIGWIGFSLVCVCAHAHTRTHTRPHPRTALSTLSIPIQALI